MDEDSDFSEGTLTFEEIRNLLELELGIDFDLAEDLEFDQEVDNGISYYFIGFTYEDQDYEVEVDAVSGEIYSISQEQGDSADTEEEYTEEDEEIVD
jgi:hypothetical protein